MTFLEALYGSQFKELTETGKDGKKGRLNGNLFLTAFVIILFIIIFTLVNLIWGSIFGSESNFLSSIYILGSGKAIGKILAIPLFALIYFGITKTVGSENNYDLYVQGFLKNKESEQVKANKKILLPFLILLFVLIIVMIF